MNKHTPGPWHAENSSVIDSQDQIVVTCFRGSVNRYDHAEDYATARLIAAAPDLLEALKLVREALQLANDTPNGPIQDTIWMMHQPETLFDFIDAAIAKATGEKE